MNEDTQLVDSKGSVSDEWKVLKALQQLAKEAADISPEAKSADKIPSLEQLVGYIVDSRLDLPICSEQLSIIYQDYGQAKPRYVAINGQVIDNSIPDNYSSKLCPADHKLITDIIDNSNPSEGSKEEVTLLGKNKLAELSGLFADCQNVLLVPMRLTGNKRIGVFVICDPHGDPRFTDKNQLIELLDIFSDLSAYFMRHNVRKRRNVALQRIQTEIMSLGENSSQLRGYEVIDAFMDGVKDEGGEIIAGTGLKDWFIGAEAYLLMKHPLDVDRLAIAYDNEKAHDNYRVSPELQLSPELEKELFGGERKALEKKPIPLNTVNEIKSAGITADCKSWVAAPLRLGKKTVIGFLVLQNKHAEYAFEDGEDEMLDALSDFLALLLARLYRERISESWRGVRDYYLEHPKEYDKRLEMLYEKIARDLEDIHGVTELAIMRYDHSDLGLNTVHSNSLHLDDLLSQQDDMLVGNEGRFVRVVVNPDKPTEDLIKTFTSLHDAVMDILVGCRKVRNDENDFSVLQPAKSLTISDTKKGDKYLVSPMRTETHGRGCFIFPAQNISGFTAGEVDDLSDALAKKIENYGRWKRYFLLTEFGREVAEFSGASVEKLIQLTHDFISKAMYTDNLYISLYDPNTNIISFPLALRNGKPWKQESGFEENIQGSERKLNKAVRGKTEEIIVSGKPILHLTQAEAIKWYKHPEHKDFASDPLASWVGVPIFSEKGVMGVIAAFHGRLDYIYSERDVFFLQQISFSVSGMLRALEFVEKNDQLKKAQEIILNQENHLTFALLSQDLTHRISNSLGGVMINLEEIKDASLVTKRESQILANDSIDLISNLLVDCKQIMSTEKTRFNLVDLIDKVIANIFNSRKIPRDVAIQTKYPREKIVISQNYRSLFDNVYSLIDNSAKAVVKKHLVKNINEHLFMKVQVIDEGDLITLRIKDNGVSVPEEIRPNLFKIGNTSDEEGTGYGLWRANMYFNELGGGIKYLGNKKNKTFEVFFPKNSFIKKKIAYIVDDESSWVRIFSRWLKEIGYEVLSANSYEETKRVAENGGLKPTLAIVDLSMDATNSTNIDGIKTAKFLKEKFEPIKLILISGNMESLNNDILKDNIFDAAFDKINENGEVLDKKLFLSTVKQYSFSG